MLLLVPRFFQLTQSCTSLQLVPKQIILPNSKLRAVWAGALLAALAYEALSLPAKLVFVGNTISPTLTAFDVFCDLVLFSDVWLRFFLAYTVDGRLVTDKKLIRKRYAKRWNTVDIVLSHAYAGLLIVPSFVPRRYVFQSLRASFPGPFCITCNAGTRNGSFP